MDQIEYLLRCKYEALLKEHRATGERFLITEMQRVSDDLLAYKRQHEPSERLEPVAERAQREALEDCTSCRLSLPGHPCGCGEDNSFLIPPLIVMITAWRMFTIFFRAIHRGNVAMAQLMWQFRRVLSFITGFTLLIFGIALTNVVMIVVGAALVGLSAWGGGPRYYGDTDQVIGKAPKPEPPVGRASASITAPAPRAIATMEECAYCAIKKRVCACKR